MKLVNPIYNIPSAFFSTLYVISALKYLVSRGYWQLHLYPEFIQSAILFADNLKISIYNMIAALGINPPPLSLIPQNTLDTLWLYITSILIFYSKATIHGFRSGKLDTQSKVMIIVSVVVLGPMKIIEIMRFDETELSTFTLHFEIGLLVIVPFFMWVAFHKNSSATLKGYARWSIASFAFIGAILGVTVLTATH